MTRLVVGITGASGSVFGVRLLEQLRAAGVESHLILSQWGARTLAHETGLTPAQVGELAAAHHGARNQASSLSSGSFRTDGMVVVPCSVKSLASIATGAGDDLIARAADVTLKERRRLVLVVREAPLTSIHLRNMLTLSDMGAVILPPVPAFYNHPQTLQDLVDHVVARIGDQFGLDLPTIRWTGQLRTSGGGAPDAFTDPPTDDPPDEQSAIQPHPTTR